MNTLKRISDRWWRGYLVHAAVGLVIWAVLVGVFWVVGWEESWADLTTAYLLFANLVVLWWYAHRTEEIVEINRAQLSASNRPSCVIDHVRGREPGGPPTYVAVNVGTGPAVNVYYSTLTFTNSGCDWSALHRLGSVRQAGDLWLRQDLEKTLKVPRPDIVHLLVVESTDPIRHWVTSASVQHSGGGLAHETEIAPERQAIGTVLDYLREHKATIEKAALRLRSSEGSIK